jgi:hypothetical protein
VIFLAVLEVLLQDQQRSIGFGWFYFTPIMQAVPQVIGSFPQCHPVAGDICVGLIFVNKDIANLVQ